MQILSIRSRQHLVRQIHVENIGQNIPLLKTKVHHSIKNYTQPATPDQNLRYAEKILTRCALALQLPIILWT